MSSDDVEQDNKFSVIRLHDSSAATRCSLSNIIAGFILQEKCDIPVNQRLAETLAPCGSCLAIHSMLLILFTCKHTNSGWWGFINQCTCMLPHKFSGRIRFALSVYVGILNTTLLLLLPFYSSLDFVRDYPDELVPER